MTCAICAENHQFFETNIRPKSKSSADVDKFAQILLRAYFGAWNGSMRVGNRRQQSWALGRPLAVRPKYFSRWKSLYTSSSRSNMFGIEFATGNRRPLSGQTREPSQRRTSSSAWCTRRRKASSRPAACGCVICAGKASTPIGRQKNGGTTRARGER